MKDNDKKQYMAPQLTVVTFRAERGYASSIISSVSLWESPEAEQMESYNQREGWTSGSDGFWL